ncbi:ADP-ribosylation/Crystallin J1 [Thermobaculum terrenum ATCC BAA-798]|uniref:ADP-ribosylation/Crystallin J1 n=1 Tax=Thermobaculum terrenum (strain ATCC BAA-798 / CCMEE 7001 / YNP1) TaxID=525904 RepID=D1CDL6_THET1|nr:ADP-ribosylglycohydrolase family protein [Thermobaculum terrenum]ACZ41022.1 ADP-ribosylation/Crystallin J1 [Thermobaculum terrenum ATCC BAA-798]
MSLPEDYLERVYAGVLGKIIGVYLGRPFEGWPYDKIKSELGYIWYYVNNKLKQPLIVTDDDISGTFTFIRALEDYGCSKDLSPEQIGNTWLNYIIENRTILWWGGLGNSTEHTAYLRLKQGLKPPQSGSIETNSKVVAEQIGAQIFIDGWGMVSPGDPEMAADLARRAACVSHDGEAIYAAQVIAAIEAQAFVEDNIEKLIDCGISFIPQDSTIYRLITDIRNWYTAYDDWEQTRELIEQKYGYDKYGGGCHVVPNHALIINALLYGKGDFQKSLMIVNTSGWDTDCNSGNVGCILGIKNGLEGIDLGPDWRSPLADRMYIASADGGRVVTDAVRESYRIANIGRRLVGMEAVSPKGGARFHFEAPGALQGFYVDKSDGCCQTVSIRNSAIEQLHGNRALELEFAHICPGQSARALTPTFIPPDDLDMPGYRLMASPQLYPGQTIRASFLASDISGEANLSLIVKTYRSDGSTELFKSRSIPLMPRQQATIDWRVPNINNQTIYAVGVEISSDRYSSGRVYLDYLTWEGVPSANLIFPDEQNSRLPWIDAVDHVLYPPSGGIALIQDKDTGLFLQGCDDWRGYTLRASISIHMAEAAGLAFRARGINRYYALLLKPRSGRVELISRFDDHISVLHSFEKKLELDRYYDITISIKDDTVYVTLENEAFEYRLSNTFLRSGFIGLVCTEGRVDCKALSITT